MCSVESPSHSGSAAPMSPHLATVKLRSSIIRGRPSRRASRNVPRDACAEDQSRGRSLSSSVDAPIRALAGTLPFGVAAEEGLRGDHLMRGRGRKREEETASG